MQDIVKEDGVDVMSTCILLIGQKVNENLSLFRSLPVSPGANSNWPQTSAGFIV